MFAKSSDTSQDVKLQADNQELIELARDNAIPVPDNEIYKLKKENDKNE